MNLVISKQRLRDIDGFFAKSFFLFTLRKNLSWGTKYVYERTIPFIFFFFSTCHGKDILELKRDMFNLATSFHMKSRRPSGWKKKWIKKKTEALKGKKSLVRGVNSILDTFENTKQWKYSINSICWEKATNLLILEEKLFMANSIFVFFQGHLFFF